MWWGGRDRGLKPTMIYDNGIAKDSTQRYLFLTFSTALSNDPHEKRFPTPSPSLGSFRMYLFQGFLHSPFFFFWISFFPSLSHTFPRFLLLYFLLLLSWIFLYVFSISYTLFACATCEINPSLDFVCSYLFDLSLFRWLSLLDLNWYTWRRYIEGT